MNTLLSIGSTLARQRRAAGISQRGLAEQLGTSQQQVARWEASGYRTASLERVAAAAEALGVTCTALPIAAETPAVYSPLPSAAASEVGAAVSPVRDLGEVAVRLRAHTEELRETYKFDRIGVFGSFAVGEQRPDSDVDLLVETDDPGGLRWVSAAIDIEGWLGRPVDLVRPDLLKARIRPRVEQEVIVVWKA